MSNVAVAEQIMAHHPAVLEEHQTARAQPDHSGNFNVGEPVVPPVELTTGDLPVAKAASGCVRVTVPISQNNLALRDAFFMGMFHSVNARAMGGKARCLKSSDSVIIEHSGLTRDQSKSLIDQLTCSRNATTLKVNVEERDSPEFDLESPGIIPGEFAWKKLDKKFLFSLPNYAIIVGPRSYEAEKPDFVAKLEPGADRSIIWRRAVDSDVHHRQCSVYWGAEDIVKIYGFSLEDLLEGNEELIPPPFRL